MRSEAGSAHRAIRGNGSECVADAQLPKPAQNGDPGDQQPDADNQPQRRRDDPALVVHPRVLSELGNKVQARWHRLWVYVAFGCRPGQPSFTAVPEALTISMLLPTDS